MIHTPAITTATTTRIGLNMTCDCSERTGRARDLCEGVGRDGRPDPRPEASDHWRAKHCTSAAVSPGPVVPLWKKAVNFASSATKHILAGRPKATPEQIQIRLEICRGCELFERNHCKQCGCACNGTTNFMNKLAWADQECPHPAGPKWGTIGGTEGTTGGTIDGAA